MCRADADCGPGFRCAGGLCEPSSSQPVSCPADMVAVAASFCIDTYEASRPDATATLAGSVTTHATSRQGVMPWQVGSNGEAELACAGAGKRLCTPAEWGLACGGAAAMAYCYGDTYEPATCNGIDTFGPGGLHLAPTGSFPGCVGEWGAADLNGNLWEHVAGGDDMQVRGGAYNCADSAALHRCTYVPRTWTPAALGFRCCSGGTGQVEPEDGGAIDVAVGDGGGAPDGGCIVDPPLPDVVAGPDGSGDAGGDDAPDGVETPDGATDGGPTDAGDAPDVGSPDAGAAHDAGPADTDVAPAPCPTDMVLVAHPSGSAPFCMDRYEASHADATAKAQGAAVEATSRAGVMPWIEPALSLQTARAACAEAGKRLCQPAEWFDACRGPADLSYPYGDAYDAAACNGIDAFCYCDGAACGGLAVCPYAHCFDQPAQGGGGPCGAALHLAPTGSFADCQDAWGAVDVAGNVWELTDTDDGLLHFRGGAYNCGNSEAMHRCDYDATWSPAAQGFRCCRDVE